MDIYLSQIIPTYYGLYRVVKSKFFDKFLVGYILISHLHVFPEDLYSFGSSDIDFVNANKISYWLVILDSKYFFAKIKLIWIKVYK